MEDFRAFWAVIPATVLDDDALPANAKILYGVISTLMRSEGYCWATNAQLASAMHCSEDVVGRWVAALTKGGHLRIEITPNRTSGGKTRRIFPALPEPSLGPDSEGYPDKKSGTYPDKYPGVPGQKVGSYNKELIKKEKKKGRTAKASEDVAAELREKAAAFGPETVAALDNFLAMRAEIKKPLVSQRAASLLYNKLVELSGKDPTVAAYLLNKATERQWLTLYALKPDDLEQLSAGRSSGESVSKIDTSGLRMI